MSNTPKIACWNINDWGLAHQVEMADAGYPVEWTIGVPILIQGADNPKRWDRFLEETEAAMARIPADAEITLRQHNWLTDFTNVAPEDRGPFEDSPLVWRLRDDGSLDSTPQIDPLGPIAAWAKLGEQIGKSYFMARLAERFPNARRIFILENNEANILEVGSFTQPIPRTPGQPLPVDEWGERLREWKPEMAHISLRMNDYKLSNPDPNKLAVAIARAYRERYEALTAALLANLPDAWKGRVYTGGYADTPVDRLDLDWRNPHLDWQYSPGTASLYFHHEKSDRVYADKSGSPATDHRRVRSPLHVALNVAEFDKATAANRLGQHTEVSVWMSDAYGRKVGRDEMGRYLSPQDALGFYRGLVWAAKADVYRYFAASQAKLDAPFYNQLNDPPEVKHWTERDFYSAFAFAVDEVSHDAKLTRFWDEGKPIYTANPSFYRWNLPTGPVTNRLLRTDADPPRFQTNARGELVDVWSQKDGQVDLNVFALAWRIGEAVDGPTMIFAYSPVESRQNVTVQVPGLNGVLIPSVGPEGVFHFAGKPLREPTIIEQQCQAIINALGVPTHPLAIEAKSLLERALANITAWEDSK